MDRAGRISKGASLSAVAGRKWVGGGRSTSVMENTGSDEREGAYVGEAGMRAGSGPVSRLMLIAIRAYQLTLGRLMPSRCRFYPSCSEYAAGAIAAHGAIGGGWLAFRRLLRCHPLHPGGYDPVPAKFGAERGAG